MSLYVRVAIGVLLAIVGAVATLVAARYGMVDDQVQLGIRNNLLGPMRVARDSLNTTINTTDRERGAELARLSGLFGYPVTIGSARAVPAQARQRWGPAEAGLFHSDDGALIAYLPLGNHASEVLLFGPLPKVQFQPSLGESALVIILGLSIVGGTAFLVVAPMVRRLRNLEHATKRLSDGELGARAAVASSDDIGRVAMHFNQMADKIQTLLEHQHQLLQAVAHEFRTPMARIRFEIEMALDAASRAERSQRLESIDATLVEMDHLVAELMTYVRFDGQHPAMERDIIPIADTLDAIVDDAQVLRAGIAVSVLERATPSDNGDSAPWLKANATYFRRVYNNLLVNALRYAQTTVHIRWHSAADAVIIEVHDDGPGIATADRERIFQPFARVDASRSRGSGGVGLGLAIVERIMTSHDGSVHVGDSDLGCARFITRWPVPAAPKTGNLFLLEST